MRYQDARTTIIMVRFFIPITRCHFSESALFPDKNSIFQTLARRLLYEYQEQATVPQPDPMLDLRQCRRSKNT
jgi:hypothetical protein